VVERSIECHVGNCRTLLAVLRPRDLCCEFLDPAFERCPCGFPDSWHRSGVSGLCSKADSPRVNHCRRVAAANIKAEVSPW
jgi:hypothetical protein